MFAARLRTGESKANNLKQDSIVNSAKGVLSLCGRLFFLIDAHEIARTTLACAIPYLDNQRGERRNSTSRKFGGSALREAPRGANA